MAASVDRRGSLKRDVGRRLAGPARAYVRHAPTTVGKSLLVRRLLEPSLRKNPRSFVARTVDGSLLGGTSNDMIQRYVYVFGLWEPQLSAWLRGRLTPGRTLVDVGANIGYFTLLGSRLVGPSGCVVAVEALPSTYAALQANVARNHVGNVRALNVAAAESERVVTLYGGEAHNSGTTSMLASSGLERLGEVAARPLADLLSEREKATARVVKVDVEGAEVAVLRGLLPALPDLPDDLELVVEVSPEHGAQVVDLLAQQGFCAYRLVNDYRPESYLEPVSEMALPRFRGPVDERLDLVFSRVDAGVLR